MSFAKSAVGAFVGALGALFVHDAISARYPALWQRWGLSADVVHASYPSSAPAPIPAVHSSDSIGKPTLRRLFGFNGDAQQCPSCAGTIEWSGRPESRREVPR